MTIKHQVFKYQSLPGNYDAKASICVVIGIIAEIEAGGQALICVVMSGILVGRKAYPHTEQNPMVFFAQMPYHSSQKLFGELKLKEMFAQQG